MTAEELAMAQTVSVNTIRTHMRSLYRKLGVRSRRDAVRRGRELGLL
jgi:LuxR family maltose regulon positive regulatory protein